MVGFLYSLDLTNPYIGNDSNEEKVRINTNKNNWDALVIYFLEKADCLIVKYWPEDLNISEDQQVSTKAYRLLNPYKFDDKPIDQGMHASFYKIDESMKKILLNTKSTDIPTDVFDFQLLKKGEVLLHSFNNGSSLFFNATKNELNDLLKNIDSEFISSVN